MLEFDQLLKEFRNLESSGLIMAFGQFLLWMCFLLLLSWLARKAANRAIRDNSTKYRVKKVIRFASYGGILILAVLSFTGKMQYFTVALGLLSAGVALALQEVILSIAGWVSIVTSNTYNPGDRIEINGVKGDVIDIGITRSTLMEIGEWVNSDNYTGRIVEVSNGAIFKGPVYNYSNDFPFLWDEVTFHFSLNSDMDLASELILEVARENLSEYARYADEHWKRMVRKYLIEDANLQPTVSMALTEDWMEFTLRYVVDYKKRRITKNLLFHQIFDAIHATEGKVILSTSTIEMVGMPDLKVDVKSKMNE